MLQVNTAGKKLHILIVDDNADFCTNCIDIFESKGYSATAVHDGFDAIEAVKGNPFDLVLMDIKMPVMNGVDTYKMLKQINPLLPVIMISAYAVEERKVLLPFSTNLSTSESFFQPLNTPRKMERSLWSLTMTTIFAKACQTFSMKKATG